MATCPKCGKELEEGAKFCDNCGEKIIETIFCPNCGEQTSSEFAFCQKCGASLGGDAPTPPPVTPEKKGSPKPLILVGAIAVVAVVAIVAAMSLLGGGGSGGKGKGNNFAMYIKDKQIVYNDFSKKGPRELTSRLVDGDMSSEQLASAASGVGYLVTFSQDGKRVFFPDRVSFGGSSGGVTLYTQDLSKKDAEALRIDSNITGYAINDAGDSVYYLKDSVLYRHDLKDKEKIASDVDSFQVTDDGKKVLFFDNEDTIYLWQPGKDKEKVASEIDQLVYWKEDLSLLFYTKENTLYKHEIGKDREKIASDITGHVEAYESGEVYYIKSEDIKINLTDYVSDENKSSDASMTEPVYPTVPDLLHFDLFYSYWRNYSTNDWRTIAQQLLDTANYSQDEYNDTISKIEQYERDQQQYSEDTAAYQAKLQRDNLRRSLESATMENTQYTLYFYDGKEEHKVTDALVSDYSGDWAYDSPVGVVWLYNQKEVKKVKLEEISNAYDVQSKVQEALYENTLCHVVTGETLTELDAEDAQDFRLSDDGKSIYFLDSVNEEKQRGDLYQVTVSGKEVGKPTVYDTDVSTYWSVAILEDGALLYFKDVDTSSQKGELYLNKKSVDYDVYLWNGSLSSEDSSSLTYYTDWNSDKGYGTLKQYKDEKAEKIADDVHSHASLPDGSILYLYDYSASSYKGDLYHWQKSKAEKIDEDVVALLTVNESNRV